MHNKILKSLYLHPCRVGIPPMQVSFVHPANVNKVLRQVVSHLLKAHVSDYFCSKQCAIPLVEAAKRLKRTDTGDLPNNMPSEHTTTTTSQRS